MQAKLAFSLLKRVDTFVVRCVSRAARDGLAAAVRAAKAAWIEADASKKRGSGGR